LAEVSFSGSGQAAFEMPKSSSFGSVSPFWPCARKMLHRGEPRHDRHHDVDQRLLIE
jgi:hypothetical protein